ncbi:complement inhibitor CirpT2-like [Ornithodoros turicata]|uniref:complement inhibitor CirpT2-like n=1 Tax=Ornithodoros turicata TaxID=34597 RepID=UPI003138B9DB
MKGFGIFNALLSASIICHSLAAILHRDVEVENGYCLWENLRISNGTSVRSESPCVAFYCMADKRSVIEYICVAYGSEEILPCRNPVPAAGSFPDCCSLACKDQS